MKLNVPAREMFWNVPPAEQAVFLALGYAVCVLFVALVGLRLRDVLRGRERLPLSDLARRLRRALREGLVRARERTRAASRCHAPLAAGLVALFVGTSLIAVEYHTGVAFLRGGFYLAFESILDLMGVVLLVAVVMMLRRTRPADRPRTRDPLGDRGLLLLVLVLAASGFVVEGLRLAVTQPEHGGWSFAGAGVAAVLTGLGAGSDAMRAAHRVLWWGHNLLALGFVAVAPLSRLFHVIAAPLNWLFRPLRPRGALSAPFDIVNQPEERVAADPGVQLGPRSIAEFPRTTLLAADACTECARCHDACPAHATGKPLSPMRIVLELREAVHARARAGTDLFEAGVFSPEELASCTTCGACVEVCPVAIDQVQMVVDLRRGRAEQGAFDGGHETALERTARCGNPWGAAPAERDAWLRAQGVEVAEAGKRYELVYWIGCAASFDQRLRDIAAAMFEILRAAGIEFAVLGQAERCTGDFARRAGDEGLFQRHVAANLQALGAVSASRVLVHCPHCFNTFRNEYPDFGALPPVVHHTQLIEELLASGRLAGTRGREQQVVFHDPCYLGRYNDVTAAPRAALRSMPGVTLVEAEQSGRQSFCCGAGGAHLWRTREGGSERIGTVRLGQLEATGATRIATGCPFCMAMLEEAAQSGERAIDVRDVAEIVRDALT